MSEELAVPHLQLVSPHSNILNQPALVIPEKEISLFKTQWLIDEMLEIARGTQGDAKKRTMVGLAAPQVGINKRIIVVDIASTGMGEAPDLRVFINPEILTKSLEVEIGREGCFSTGNICGIVDRSKTITIKAFDRFGKIITEESAGFTARIFQHEVDHLDGIRFPDRITEDARLHWVEPDEFGEYRIHWREWNKLCDRQRWEEIKKASRAI